MLMQRRRAHIKAIAPALKDSTNPAFRSKYADLGSVWDAVRDALQENDLAVVQMPTHSEDGRVHLLTMLMHVSGEAIQAEASIPVAKQDAHGYGSGLTYLRRYSLAALLGVVSDDDDGNAAVEKPKEKTGFEQSSKTVACAEYESMTPEQQTEIQLHASIMQAKLKAGDVQGAARYFYDDEEPGLTNDERVAVWHFFDSKQRRAITNEKPAVLATQA